MQTNETFVSTEEQQDSVPQISISTFSDLQVSHTQFSERNQFTDTPARILDHLSTEIRELDQAIAQHGDRESEAADIVIFASSLTGKLDMSLHQSVLSCIQPTFRPQAETIAGMENVLKEQGEKAVLVDMPKLDLQSSTITDYLLEKTKRLTALLEAKLTNTMTFQQTIGSLVLGLFSATSSEGIRMQDELGQKTLRNYHKYKPSEQALLITNGLSPEQARLVQKGKWNPAFDTHYIPLYRRGRSSPV